MAFTFFFRDSQTLEWALDDALPGLQGRAFIHVWDAGCAHGPEPFTLAMLLRERVSDYVFRNIRIHATDIDATFADQVKSGVFREQEVQRVPAEYFKKYFRRSSQPGWVEVVPQLREKIEFSRHDLLSCQAVREGLSLIVCKNVLLHFHQQQRTEVLQMFHQALQPGGTLVLENTQKLPEMLEAGFQRVTPSAQIYRKVDSAITEPRVEEGRTFWLGQPHLPAVREGSLPGRQESGRRTRA